MQTLSNDIIFLSQARSGIGSNYLKEFAFPNYRVRRRRANRYEGVKITAAFCVLSVGFTYTV